MNKKLKLLSKIVGVTAICGATGLYVLHNYTGFSQQREKFNWIKYLQLQSTVTIMSDQQITKIFGPDITTSIKLQDGLKNFDENAKTFSFVMDGKSGRNAPKETPRFAEILVNNFKSEKRGWNVESIDIKFVNSNSKIWQRVLDSIRLDDLDCKSSSINLENIINSNKLEDTSEYLKKYATSQPFLLKAVEILLNNHQKMNSLGPPIKLIDHSIFPQQNMLKLNIEGKKKNAIVLVQCLKSNDVEKDKENWDIDLIYLMYELIEDNMLTTSQLALKYSEQFFDSIQLNPDYNHLLKNEINLNKILEEKILNNNRLMNTIGRPLEITIDLNDKFNKINENMAKIKLRINGKLNKADFIMDLINDENSDKIKKWKMLNNDLKIIWNESDDNAMNETPQN